MRILQNHYVLAVHDAQRSADFYVRALGFEIVAEPDGWIFVRNGDCMIMLGECPDDMHPSELGCHNYFGYLRVDDVDAYHASISASGLAPPIGPIADESWGMREFSLTTPDGHRIRVGQIIRSSADDSSTLRRLEEQQ
jgi:catechol 2,3-dioxygenase-like lactoylglutathione lyase family enzyme